MAGAKTEKAPLTMEQRELCSKHLGLAEAMARKRSNPYVSPEDRLQDAYMGLIDAARNFDPDAGHAFPAYASARIRGAMIDAERERAHGGVKAGRRVLGRGESSPVVRSFETRLRRLGAPADYSGGESVHLGNALAVPEPAVKHDDRDAIDVALRSLPERERRIVVRYWMDGETLEVAAAEVGVSQSRASQLMPRLMADLRGHSALADYRGVGWREDRAYKAWTPEEDRLLSESYGRESASAIAARLGRTRQGVSRRITTLGLAARGRQEVA